MLDEIQLQRLAVIADCTLDLKIPDTGIRTCSGDSVTGLRVASAQVSFGERGVVELGPRTVSIENSPAIAVTCPCSHYTIAARTATVITA